MTASLTVLICTYNRSSSLVDTLASVNACILPPDCAVELIVVDNNSTDDTAACCAAFAPLARMPFRTVTETAQGLSHARNRGIREAAGDVVIFTDDDVLVNSEWLVIYAAEFGAEQADAAFGRIHPEWRGRRPEWFSNILRPAYAVLDYGDARLTVTSVANEFFGANFAVRRELLLSLGGFDVGLGRTSGKLYIGEETLVFLELLRRACRIIYNPRIEVYHVIEESRKEKAYLLRYYHDTAGSIVHVSLQGSPARRLLGVPYYRVYELAEFYALALPRYVLLRARRDRAGLFALRLFWLRYNRMVQLYLREWARGERPVSMERAG